MQGNKGTKFRVHLPAIKTGTEMQNAQEQKLEFAFGDKKWLRLQNEDSGLVRISFRH